VTARDIRTAIPLLVLGALLAVASTGGFAASGAIFVDTSAADATITAGSWSSTRYLYHRPSPPTADTPAQVDLPVGVAVPTAATLFNLSADCDNTQGRRITRGSGLPSESDVCRYVDWRLPAVTTDTRLTGVVTATIWAAKSNPQGRTPDLVAYLRAWDGAGHVELASARVAMPSNELAPITFTFPVDTTLVTGQALELKLVVDGFNRNVTVAYDTAAYPSSITLP
jgi:hypothetical protein